MVAQLMPAPHPILGAVAAAQDALKAVRDVQPVFMIPAEKEAAVAEIARLEAMAAELKLRVVAAAEDARAEAGARDNGAWWASVTRADFPAGRAQGRLAEALDRRWTRVATGMADGLVSPAQATVVVQVLDDLPDHLDPELRRAGRDRDGHPVRPVPALPSSAASAGTSSRSSHPRSPRPRKPNGSRTKNNEPGRRPASAPG